MTGGSRSGFGGRSASVGIGQVMAELRPEFPDISPSKIRFLEAEGLILPQRAESGYRRFAVADVERLRYILTVQRDEYLPLRVIKERLAALDAGGWLGGVPRAPAGGTAAVGVLADGSLGGVARRAGSSALGNGMLAGEGLAAGIPGPASAATGTAGAGTAVPLAMARSELIEASGADDALLTELEDYGLVRRARKYSAEALKVAQAAVALREYGIQPRHLRAVKAAAEREISLVEQVVAPLARQKASREPAQRAGRAVATLIASLHATLMEEGLTDAGLASALQVTGTYEVTAPQAPGLRSASGR
jgi:hypothetical protein